jgi:hypothetical protein
VEETELLLIGSGGGAGSGGAAGAVALERFKITAEKRPDLILLAFERSIRRHWGCSRARLGRCTAMRRSK